MTSVTLLFAGDFCIRDSAVKNLTDDVIGAVSKDIRALTKTCDFSVVNVETVFTDNPTPAVKSGPNIHTPLKGLELLQAFGFTAGAMANNHVCDQGDTCGLISKQKVEELGMRTVGYGKNLAEATKPLRLNVKNKTFSMLNFAENEFVCAAAQRAGFAPFDTYANALAVEAEKQSADYVLAMIHGGNEECPFPRFGMKQYAHNLIDRGADAVIIAHSHCPQGIETYKGKPIAYSMGNFLMTTDGNPLPTWEYGYMVKLTVTEDTVSYEPIPYTFDRSGGHFAFLQGEKKEAFLGYLKELSALLSLDDGAYQKLCDAWSVMFYNDYRFLFEQAKNTAAPQPNDMLFIKNVLCCESHNEMTKNYVKLFTEGKTADFADEIARIQTWQSFTC